MKFIVHLLFCLCLICIIGLCFFIFCANIHCAEDTGVFTSVLALLVTLLLGWNIYQLVDFNSKTKNLDFLKEKQEKDINYIHNKADYNQALVYSMMSQLSSAHFAFNKSNEEKFIKFQMLLKGITAMKILSNLPGCKKEISSLSKTLIEGLNNSTSVSLDEETKTKLLLMCGEIIKKEEITELDAIIKLIKG